MSLFDDVEDLLPIQFGTEENKQLDKDFQIILIRLNDIYKKNKHPNLINITEKLQNLRLKYPTNKEQENNKPIIYNEFQKIRNSLTNYITPAEYANVIRNHIIGIFDLLNEEIPDINNLSLPQLRVIANNNLVKLTPENKIKLLLPFNKKINKILFGKQKMDTKEKAIEALINKKIQEFKNTMKQDIFKNMKNESSSQINKMKSDIIREVNQDVDTKLYTDDINKLRLYFTWNYSENQPDNEHTRGLIQEYKKIVDKNKDVLEKYDTTTNANERAIIRDKIKQLVNQIEPKYKTLYDTQKKNVKDINKTKLKNDLLIDYNNRERMNENELNNLKINIERNKELLTQEQFSDIIKNIDEKIGDFKKIILTYYNNATTRSSNKKYTYDNNKSLEANFVEMFNDFDSGNTKKSKSIFELIKKSFIDADFDKQKIDSLTLNEFFDSKDPSIKYKFNGEEEYGKFISSSVSPAPVLTPAAPLPVPTQEIEEKTETETEKEEESKEDEEEGNNKLILKAHKRITKRKIPEDKIDLVLLKSFVDGDYPKIIKSYDKKYRKDIYEKRKNAYETKGSFLQALLPFVPSLISAVPSLISSIGGLFKGKNAEALKKDKITMKKLYELLQDFNNDDVDLEIVKLMREDNFIKFIKQYDKLFRKDLYKKRIENKEYSGGFIFGLLPKIISGISSLFGGKNETTLKPAQNQQQGMAIYTLENLENMRKKY